MVDNKANLSGKQWYIVNTYSGHEKKVEGNLRRTLEALQQQTNEEVFFRIIVAEQEVSYMKKDKEGNMVEKTKMKNLYPGYIFVEMIMTDDTWYCVRNTQGVTGIVGSSGGGQKPTPVTKDEMEPVLKRMGVVDTTMFDRYEVGKRVKVIHGPLEGTEGVIIDIDKDTGLCHISVTFFGRTSNIDVDFADIDLI